MTPSLSLCVLGSGSSGNATLVAAENTRLLVDAGLSAREIARRLEAVNVRIGDLAGVCVSHEHDDHIRALGVLQRRCGVPLYANAGTVEAVERSGKAAGCSWNVFITGRSFRIGELTVHPFSVPHDAYDPVGFVISHGEARVGLVTDMGMATDLIRERLRGCRAVVIEANHDAGMLREAERPWSLKQRIAGRQGHLSNEQAAELAVEISGPGLERIFLAHLSRECNAPQRALEAVTEALRGREWRPEVRCASPDCPTELVRL